MPWRGGSACGRGGGLLSRTASEMPCAPGASSKATTAATAFQVGDATALVGEGGEHGTRIDRPHGGPVERGAKQVHHCLAAERFAEAALRAASCWTRSQQSYGVMPTRTRRSHLEAGVDPVSWTAFDLITVYTPPSASLSRRGSGAGYAVASPSPDTANDRDNRHAKSAPVTVAFPDACPYATASHPDDASVPRGTLVRRDRALRAHSTPPPPRRPESSSRDGRQALDHCSRATASAWAVTAKISRMPSRSGKVAGVSGSPSSKAAAIESKRHAPSLSDAPMSATTMLIAS